MADDSVIVKFGGSIENLTTAVDAARGSIESLASPFTGLTSAAAGFGEAFAAAFAVHEVEHFAESMAALGTETTRASQILGVSTEEVGALKLVAQASGGSLEELQTAFGRLSRNVIDETPNAKRALDALGLSFADIRSKSPEAQLELLASKFQGIKDGADKDAIAIELLGRAGVNLVPIFNQGAEGIARWADASKELGSALSSETVAAMEEMHTALTEMTAAIQGTSVQAFLSLKGALIGAVDGARDLASWFTNSAREGGAMADGMQILSASLSALVAALAVATAAVKELVASFSYLADVAGIALNSIIEQVGNLGSALLHLDFSGVKSEWNLFGDEIKKRTDAYTKDVASANANMFQELQTIFQTGDKKIEAEHAQHQAHMAAAGGGNAAKGNNDALETARKEIDGEIKAMQEGLSLKKTVWDGEVATHKLSKASEYTSLMQATEKEYQAELALLEKEKALQGQKPQAIQEINNKIGQLQASHDLKMVKLDQEALAEETASWERLSQVVTTSFNSQLRGLITGTTSFKNAFKAMTTDMLVNFAEVVQNMAVKWATGQLGQTTATVTGAQARATAEIAGSTASDSGTLAAVFRSISASAAETFAGVFGFLSPVLGPAAAGPAAGAEATVLAAGAAIGGLAVGAWELPSDMLAMVHKGEMVVPAGVTPWAQGLISGAANTPGVSTVHVHHATNFNVSAMDSRGIKQFFNDHGRTIMRTINESVRTGSHVGLSKLGHA